MSTSTLKTALTDAFSCLNRSESGRIDSEILLAHVLQKSRAFLYTHPETKLSKTQYSQFKNLMMERQQGKPIAYLIGQREFWSLPLKVNSHTLIPRPETELLVEITLNLLRDAKDAQVLDLGTGSGAIALALAKERPQWTIWACDFSLEALKVAQENAHDLKLENVSFFHSDWFTNLPIEKKFSAIVANPPYLAPDDLHLQQGDLRFEPRSALVSDNEGLHDLNHIIKQSFSRLNHQGFLLLEHGYLQKKAVLALLAEQKYQSIHSWQDTAGHFRVSGGQR